MQSLREYLLSVLGAAMVCSVLRQFMAGKGPGYSLGKMLCGLFLLFTLLSPLAKFQWKFSLDSLEDIRQEGQQIADVGAEKTESALRSSISQQTKAYILDKAASFDADLAVTVTLSDAQIPVPVKVTISGAVSPYGKAQLQAMIERDLGIAKEDIIWT